MQEKSDVELLREYAAQANETAFREIVSRHADLVYASALRQVSSPELAHDIAQHVFTDLAGKANHLAQTLTGDASILGWLYRSTRFVALNQLRADRRRLARERQAMQHFDSASENPPKWERVQPVLDEAMADLSDEDRDALLLRFFKSHDFRAIGNALGVSEDAAQKRVSRALERLRTHLTSRGVTTTAITLSTALSTNAVPLAPAGLAAALSTAALAGTTLATTATAAATKAIVMTTLQKTIMGATLVVAVGTGIYETRQALTLRHQNQWLQQQQAPLAEQNRQFQSERDETTRQIAALQQDNERLNRNTSELLRLRGEITRLRSEVQLAQTTNTAANSTDAAAKAWLSRVEQLKHYLEQNPNESIPEMHFLLDKDWLGAASNWGSETENFEEAHSDYLSAAERLRGQAESRFATRVQVAMVRYSTVNHGQSPTDLSQLLYYCEPTEREILQEHYQIKAKNTLAASEIKNLTIKSDWFITRTKAVISNYHLAIFPYNTVAWESSSSN